MSVFAIKDGIAVELHPGEPVPRLLLATKKELGFDHGIGENLDLTLDGSAYGSKAIFHKPEDNAARIRHYGTLTLKDLYEVAYLGIGVHPQDGGCNLSCDYCSNWFGQRGPLTRSYHPKKSVTADALAKLIRWLTPTSRYWINWDIGEVLYGPGIALMEELQERLTLREVSRCNNVVLHTNGLHLISREFPVSVWEKFPCRRELRWTFNLIDAGPGSHLSVERHLPQLLKITDNFSKVDGIRTLLVFLPTDMDIRRLPKLMSDLARVVKAAGKHVIVFDYVWHFESLEALKLHHSLYYPNMLTASEFLYDEDLLPDDQWVSSHFVVDEFNAGLPNTQRPVLYAGDGKFLMPDSRLLDADKPSETYPDYLRKPLPNRDYLERCYTCPGLVTCPITGRDDFNDATAAAKEAGIEDALHAQLRDQGLWSNYLYAMILIRRTRARLKSNGAHLQQRRESTGASRLDADASTRGEAVPTLPAQASVGTVQDGTARV